MKKYVFLACLLVSQFSFSMDNSRDLINSAETITDNQDTNDALDIFQRNCGA